MKTRSEQEAEMWALIREQGGVAATYQIKALGVSDQTVKSRIKTGSLERVCYGIVAAAGVPRTPVFKMALGTLMAGPRKPGKGITAAICGSTAAALHDLIDPVPDDPIHVLSTRKMHAKEGFIFHWSSRIPENEIVTIDRISVTDGPRTLIDVAAEQPFRTMSLYRRGLRRGVFTADEVADRIERESRQGRAGICKVREALELTGDKAERARSALEDHFFDLLVGAGYPPPARNVKVTGLSRDWEVDLFYRERSFGIEVSPSWWHSDPLVADKDARKLWELGRAGTEILVVTEFTTDTAFLAAVAAVLGPPGHFPVAETVA